jgi:hypothetical protein
MKANDETVDNQAWGLDLSTYGSCQAIYDGEGTLTLSTGENLDCAFQAGQLANGEVTLLCASDSYSFLPFEDSVISFNGVTSDGYKLFSDGRIIATNYLPDTTRSGSYGAFHLEKLSAKASESGTVRRVHFGITNFRFLPTAATQENNRNLSVLPLRLRDTSQQIDLYLKRVENYDKLVQQIQTLKGIGVTCEVVAHISSEEMVAPLEDVVDNLCRILSVARGTKIQWIYCAYYDESGAVLGRTHFEHVTKAYCPLDVISCRYEGRIETRRFIEDAYPLYLERRDPYKLNRGTIDSYLDAKAEEDYLEMRAVKLAVALEKLKAAFLAQQGDSTKGFVIDEALFNSLKPKMKSALGELLQAEGIGASARSEIYGNVGGLNRKSFAQLLTGFLNFIGLTVPPQDLQLFIQCRNKLVHTGEFYSEAASTEEKKKCKPLPTPADEYYFMVNFLDRAFLKLLGYSDNYVDYRTL